MPLAVEFLAAVAACRVHTRAEARVCPRKRARSALAAGSVSHVPGHSVRYLPGCTASPKPLVHRHCAGTLAAPREVAVRQDLEASRLTVTGCKEVTP